MESQVAKEAKDARSQSGGGQVAASVRKVQLQWTAHLQCNERRWCRDALRDNRRMALGMCQRRRTRVIFQKMRNSLEINNWQ